MKLQAASVKEIRRMATGTLICMVLQLIGFVLLHLLGMVRFDYRVILGTLGGVLVANASFILLCRAVERAVDTNDEKLRKSRMQLSYNLRLFLQAGWVVIAFIAPCFNVLAAAPPLLYPTVIIFYLQRKGTLVEPSERKNPEIPEEDEESEDRLESFEV